MKTFILFLLTAFAVSLFADTDHASELRTTRGDAASGSSALPSVPRPSSDEEFTRNVLALKDQYPGDKDAQWKAYCEMVAERQAQIQAALDAYPDDAEASAWREELGELADDTNEENKEGFLENLDLDVEAEENRAEAETNQKAEDFDEAKAKAKMAQVTELASAYNMAGFEQSNAQAQSLIAALGNGTASAEMDRIAVGGSSGGGSSARRRNRTAGVDALLEEEEEEEPSEGAGDTASPGGNPELEKNVSKYLDEATYADLAWDYGGFNGAKADGSEVIIGGLEMKKDGLSFDYATDLSSWGLENSDASGALACLFVLDNDGKWVGGKFDWISSSRETRDFKNVYSGYEGWDLSNVPKSTTAAFVIVSKDGRKRSNVITARWDR